MTRQKLAKICILATKRDYFTYLCADELQPKIGSRVWVPFGNKVRLGIMLGWQNTTDVPLTKLKYIECVIDKEVLFNDNILDLCFWVSQYYQVSLSEVLLIAIPKYYRLGKSPQTKLPAVINNNCNSQPLLLNQEQLNVFNIINANLDKYYCFLLHGVTGSGKTEIYLQITAKILAQNKQILIIVPEIGLTPQLVATFTARFSEHIVVIHSNLTEKSRQKAWYQAHTQIAKIVIGTRTAIFTSMTNLGLIIIDEEHDQSLKQMEGVHYSARDTAIMRAYFTNIPIILGSATPSLESLYNCQKNKAILLNIKQRVIASKPLYITITDLRNTKIQHGLANSTLKTINEHLKKKEQVLIFINRRGFAPVLLCNKCNWIVDCIDCDSHLTLHHKDQRLICHHCGYSCHKPKQCRNCNNAELIPVGYGTQRLYEFLQKKFPQIELIRIDRDEIAKKDTLINKLNMITQEKVQLIVGTQMLAKGHHFPNLTLVVIVDVDCGFYNHDYKSLEHLGQLLVQVSGRAGRSDLAGKVIIQTHFPQHPLLNILIKDGYTKFAQTLLESRLKTLLPPYSFLAKIRAQHSKYEQVLKFMQHIKSYGEHHTDQKLVIFFGPAPAPLMRKANQYHLQILIKAEFRKHLQKTLLDLRLWIIHHKYDSNIRWHIDVDPIDLS